VRAQLRTAVAAAGLLGLAPACTTQTGLTCPGQRVASLAMQGTLDDGATGCVTPPPGGWSVKPAISFDADFTFEDALGRLDYCSGGPHAAPLYGTRSGDHLRAEATVPGAVLAACGATCTPRMTLVVEGDLSPAAPGAATFAGTLTETFDDSTGGCGACVLPCTSTYDLAGQPR
jgi:hypothetical protein